MTELELRLRSAAARVLRVPAQRIAREAPLARYGLDSLNAVELAVAITDLAAMEFSDELLVEYPSIAAIAEHLAGTQTRVSPLETMRLDSALADDIAPKGAAQGDAILLTGATGFLGGHLLDALLRNTSREVLCLVRACDDAGAQARLGGRVRAVAGDIEQPRLGLMPARHAELASRVGSVIHCAAAVDWSLGYESLRAPNVLATLELLRFAACQGRKDFHYVSSLATCYPAAIHLGYAQSKCVAEQLVRAAGARGLEVSIYRPALIAGHSVTGIGNNEDFLASLIKGCIALGAAPDLQWRMDVCPVDFVAEAIARLSQGPPTVAHLLNPRPAGWLEAVLWMNLRGYRVRPMPFARWIELVETQSLDPQHPLHRLRGFLLQRPAGEGGRYLAELYAEQRLDSTAMQAPLAELGIECPRLEPRLLEKWFDAYERSGFLSPAVLGRRRSAPLDVRAALENAIRTKIDAIRPFSVGGESSILGELASWRAGSALALRGYSLEIAARRLDVVVKPKLDDATVLEVACEVARLCDPELGAAFAAHCRRTSLAGTARREIAIYRSGLVSDCAPACHGVIRSTSGDALVLEHVAELQGNDPTAEWQRADIETAIDGISQIHATQCGLDAAPWLAPVPDDNAVDLWLALADYARPWISAWAGPPAAKRLARLALSSVDRTRALEGLPRALIHHDFNPRNIGLRRGRLCALDWELATLGVPQRDLAELLCFVLTPQTSPETLSHYVEHHRRRLAHRGREIERERWIEGFALALEDFALQRLSMYFMAHRFRPQPYLERVVRTWARLSTIVSSIQEPEHAAV